MGVLHDGGAVSKPLLHREEEHEIAFRVEPSLNGHARPKGGHRPTEENQRDRGENRRQSEPIGPNLSRRRSRRGQTGDFHFGGHERREAGDGGQFGAFGGAG